MDYDRNLSTIVLCIIQLEVYVKAQWIIDRPGNKGKNFVLTSNFF